MHVVIDEDGMDAELDDLQSAWMVEDAHEGVVEALTSCFGCSPAITYALPLDDGHVVHGVGVVTPTSY